MQINPWWVIDGHKALSYEDSVEAPSLFRMTIFHLVQCTCALSKQSNGMNWMQINPWWVFDGHKDLIYEDSVEAPSLPRMTIFHLVQCT